MVYCSECGTKNSDGNTFCENCEAILIKPEYFDMKSYNDFNQIFTNENKKILEELSISISDYDIILENIKEQSKSKYKKLIEGIPHPKQKSMDTLSKITLITLAFTKISYKKRGAELGSYSFNLINIDDRLTDANKISTLIHELTHHIIAEIFKQTLMYLLEVKKSDALESLVWFTLIMFPTSVLMGEYCAHTVEGRFIPHGYQNYGSFNELLDNEFEHENEEDMKNVKTQLAFANSLAKDIINLLEEFITPQLREEIKSQFIKDFNYPPNYNQISFETKETIPDQLKVSLINNMLSSTFENAQNTDFINTLKDFEEKFRIVNRIKDEEYKLWV